MSGGDVTVQGCVTGMSIWIIWVEYQFMYVYCISVLLYLLI
jgi:hypothetical protein